ncbi:MAG: hypothetical protein JNL35_01210 [Sphingopyxis sp.]|nr:hypothetical protein [Sphingopyxis sp.]
MAIVLQRGKSRIYRDSLLADMVVTIKWLKNNEKYAISRESGMLGESRFLFQYFYTGRS